MNPATPVCGDKTGFKTLDLLLLLLLILKMTPNNFVNNVSEKRSSDRIQKRFKVSYPKNLKKQNGVAEMLVRQKTDLELGICTEKTNIKTTLKDVTCILPPPHLKGTVEMSSVASW